MSAIVQATDPQGVTFDVTDGVGSINANTGIWTYTPSCVDVGQNLFSTITVTDGLGASSTCTFSVIVTDLRPTISSGCGDWLSVYQSQTVSTDFEATTIDCDSITWLIGDIVPTPVGEISIDNNGTITFATDLHDGGNSYSVPVIAADCGGAADTCFVTFDVLPIAPYSIRIEQTKNTIQGGHEYVDVTLEGGTQPLGGFDFLISFDTGPLYFITATVGDLFDSSGCGWEYFNYRFSTFDTCASACATGKLRIVGIAETNNGPINHPHCFFPDSLPATLFTLDFLISENLTYECQFVPIRFVWFDCGDNSVANPGGDTLYISRYVYDSDSSIVSDSTGTYPTWLGAQLCDEPDPQKPDPYRFIDYYDGGIDIVCADSIDMRGDINFNFISNELADAVLFQNYFVFGISVFHVNLQGQIAATDVNFDGIALSVADLVYLDRVVVGDAAPYPNPAPISRMATYSFIDDTLIINATVAAATVVVEGDIRPTSLAANMGMLFAFDGTNTRILIHSDIENSNVLNTFSGAFLLIHGTILSVEFASPDGGIVYAYSSCCAGMRGNVNSSGVITITDITYFVNYFFRNGPTPFCLFEADINGNGGINISDLTFLVDYLFRSGPQPPACP